MSFCLPSAVAIITKSFVGQRRNFAFAAMGGGQPIGFTIGLAVGGVLTDSVGWRWGFYLSAIFDAIICAVAFWGLPKSIDDPAGTEGPTESSWTTKWTQLKHEVDWIGALIASSSLAMLSYVFAYVLLQACKRDACREPCWLTINSSITGNTTDIVQPSSIALLSVSVALIPVFIYWVGRQEKRGKPAIIPVSH